jgi:hypothetical protein
MSTINQQAAFSDAINSLQKFAGANLTHTLARIEESLRKATLDNCAHTLVGCGAKSEVLGAAGLVKGLAGQIHVIIHALGILLSLPHILEPGEVIEYVSLGAGNTGRAFDLETDRRIAEFKFIRWQGGPEAIRQNALFKDFYLLAEEHTQKRRYLYVLGLEHPRKFFASRRSISSVLSRNVKLLGGFTAKFADQHRTVRDYYDAKKHMVMIEDILPFVPELIAVADDAEAAIL